MGLRVCKSHVRRRRPRITITPLDQSIRLPSLASPYRQPVGVQAAPETTS
jgi:hypothetical protein